MHAVVLKLRHAMKLDLLIPILLERRRLLRRERCTRAEILAYQRSQLQALRTFAFTNGPFYRELHHGMESAAYEALPIVTKSMVMSDFDRVLTTPEISRESVQAFVASGAAEDRLAGKYEVSATSGSSGVRGIFPVNKREWTQIIASYSRSYAWAGIKPGLFTRTKMAVVSTTKPWHQSARVGATVGGKIIPTLRLDATESIESLASSLNRFQPQTLIGYPSILRVLALEQRNGRLSIAPKTVMSASEVLTSATRELIEKTWSVRIFNVYGATEAATIASECEYHNLHLFEDLVVVEVVDEKNRSVPVGTVGAKVLITPLFYRTLPLIRYELTDRFALTNEVCPCGRPFSVISDLVGRQEDVIAVVNKAGTKIQIPGNVFHDAIEPLPVRGWQIGVKGGEVRVLVESEREDLITEIRTRLNSILMKSGIHLEVEHVDSLEHGLTGKVKVQRVSES